MALVARKLSVGCAELSGRCVATSTGLSLGRRNTAEWLLPIDKLSGGMKEMIHAFLVPALNPLGNLSFLGEENEEVGEYARSVSPAEFLTCKLLARLEGRSALKEIEPYLFADEDSSVHGDILEFHGPEGTGKTEMLYHLTARCVLPKSEGGLEVEVLFIDTDYRFDMLRLVTILERRLSGGSSGSEDEVKRCLGRLFVVSCGSSTHLLLTLHSLESTVCGHPSLCLLILDSLSAFYWIDRANGGESVNSQESALKKCSQFLEKLAHEYRLVVFATTQSLMQKASAWTEGPSSAGADYRPYLCKAWQRVVKHRLFFSRPEDLKTSNRFSLVSHNLKSNSYKKHVFIIGESGIEFC